MLCHCEFGSGVCARRGTSEDDESELAARDGRDRFHDLPKSAEVSVAYDVQYAQVCRRKCSRSFTSC